MALAALIARLDSALAKRYAAAHRGLRPGAGAPELKRIPKSLVPLYKWRNGSAGELYGDYRWLSIDEALAERKRMDGLAAKPDGPGAWRKDWFPFLSDQAGRLVCLDLGQSFGKEPGQIIEYDHEAAPAAAFGGLEAWVETLLALIAKGTLLGEDDATFHAVLKSKNPGYPHTGSPELQKLKDDIRARYDASKYTEMLRVVDKALKVAPADADLYQWRWMCLEQLDRDAEALAAMDRELALARPTKPPGYRTYRSKAECLLRLGRQAEAAEALDAWMKLIEASPHPDTGDLTAACRLLGRELRERGEMGRARKVYEKALPAMERESKGAHASFDYGYWTSYQRCLTGADRRRVLEKARLETEKLIAKRPSDAESRYYVAYFCHALGDDAAALEQLGRAVELNPDYATEAKEDDDFLALRKDPRFIAICA